MLKRPLERDRNAYSPRMTTLFAVSSTVGLASVYTAVYDTRVNTAQFLLRPGYTSHSDFRWTIVSPYEKVSKEN
ncbi:hypothetical protein DTO207G8_2319 [Paecilomyces variotii]|nr:hypothetical protein DTO169E5_1437 [Paecilomyces variotii]KAJ9257147.1 hypothetical protein DTO207G8_2319 [Paecilomyces variotii]